MFYVSKGPTKICPTDVTETLRVSDPVKICATKLRKSVRTSTFYWRRVIAIQTIWNIV